jgi:RNA polymerase sigma-70 factor (ECF subfamily)
MLRSRSPRLLRQHIPDALPMSPAESSAELTQTYQSLRGPLLGYLRRLVGDAQAAEDVLQDVLVKAIASLRSDAAPPRNLAAWLYRVAHNAAMDHHRARRPSQSLDDELAEVLPAPEVDPALAAAALSDCMRPLLSILPESYRSVVHASELEGRSLREIADAHGISLDAAKQRASRGRRQLRDELLRCCEVALSAQGQVVDFSPRGERCSAPCGSACSR